MSDLIFQKYDRGQEEEKNGFNLPGNRIVDAQERDIEKDLRAAAINGEDGEGILEQTEEVNPLPEYACAYCGIHCKNSVVKCNTCNNWFCNSKTDAKGSHIITHLVMARHNLVSLHEDSDLGDTTLECYNCGNKNVFILGFVSAKQESVVVLLCRLPCAQQKDINWDTNHWQSLIEERQFLPWIASNPPEEELMHAKKVTHQQIAKLEAQWKLNREATIEDVKGDANEEEEVLPILMRYNDAFQYQRSFAPLIKLEADYDKNLKESQALERIQVKWGVGLNNKFLASFILSTYENSELKVAVGDEIILRYNGLDGEEWTGSGYILRLPNAHQEEFTLELNPSKIPPPIHVTTGFTAEFVWKGTSYDRMQESLRQFALDEKLVSGYIYHKILGHEVAPVEFDVKIPNKLSLKKMAQLNTSQENAVRTVLQRPLSLIQGPPGTGKTVTSATIVYHLSKLGREKVLVCAPSNVAVDHLAAKLHLLGLNVVRLTAKSREDVESSVDHLALHNIVNRTSKNELKRLITLKNELGELAGDDAKAFRRLTRVEEMRTLNKCDVVCCTCVGAGDRRLSKLKFMSVLIDESTQASEPEVLIPIVKGAKQVILVGDHQQLGPVILDKKAGDAGLKQSLFERLILLGHIPIRLEVQYRMNPCLSEFPSNMFYEGSLQNGITSKQRSMEASQFPWPVNDTPMMFWANYGREEISASGNSFLNRVEAMNVERIITKLFKDGVSPDDIGVITPYEGQRAYLVQYMSMNSTIVELRDQYLLVEITSVDAFQGREKNFIILSCVRANDQQSIGFLSDSRRLNVALTRARFGLAILGNPRALCRNPLWNHLLIHFREKGCLVDGSLDNLQLSMVQLHSTKSKMNDTLPATKQIPHKYNDLETSSMLSYAPEDDPALQKEQWPMLGSDNSYTNEKGRLQSNYYSRLDTNNNQDKGVKNEGINNLDMQSLSASLAASFNLG